jgi:cytochrome P450
MAPIQRGELVTISIAGANRDPEVFPRKPPELHVLWGPPASR